MLHPVNLFVASLLLNASTLFNPVTPAPLPFEASAFVTNTNRVRVSVVKSADVPVTIVLRNQQHEVVHEQVIGKKTPKHTLLLTLDELTDGEYELEIKSGEGSIRKNLRLSTTPVVQSVRVVSLP